MRLKGLITTVLLSVLPTITLAENALTKPKLVVGLVVDQMRWDYLYKFSDRYQDSGFKRMVAEGFTSENTYINYVPTYTAVGHSSIYTGSLPAIHGITGNDFIMQQTGNSMYCTQDDSVRGVGGTGKVGQQSPRNLLTTTITDQLKLATNFKSKVIGIAIKDRGGILPAGHFADAAYWYDNGTGHWLSSTYYMEQLPNWVSNFNQKQLPDTYFKTGWDTLYPIESYTLSLSDDNPYEAPLAGEKKPTLPRNLQALQQKMGYGLLPFTPYGNTFTLEFAKEAIQAENLGHNPAGATDFLAISLSATDYIGHQFSINSVEIEDTYLRLDQEIADFLKFLDESVGKDSYTLFLTADHGASHNPQFIVDHRGNAGYFDERAQLIKLNQKLAEQFGEATIALQMMNFQVHLNHALIQEKLLDEEKIRRFIVQTLAKEEGITFVNDINTIGNSAMPSIIKERIINGYHPKRSGDIVYILEPQWIDGVAGEEGSTHGTWGSYDAHIPAVFMGWGIQQGQTMRPVYITDIAPTIAQILKIEAPNGSVGQPIFEAIK